jgi:hypothetical protein
VTAGEPKTSFRPRSAFVGRLAVGRGDGAVLVEPSVAGELRLAAALAGSRPAAGLLYGYCHHDDEGGYTLVDGFVPADSGLSPFDADPWTVRDRLRAEAARSYPGATEVGWWRSAPRPGEERPGQEGWADPGAWPLGERPEGVGLVVFADGTPPAAAAQTPHSVVRGTVLEDRLGPPGPPETTPAPAPPAPSPAQPSSPAPGPPTPGPQPLRPVSMMPVSPAAYGRPTRGRTGPPVQSPLLVNQDELRSRRRVEHERGGLFELEAQQWVLLLMVILVLVIVVTVAVMVSRAIH